MANWPSIANPSRPMSEETYLPQVRTEFEGNYVQSRARVSRSRSVWPLHWNAMTEADYQTLLTFFKANQGSSFTWVHPVSSVSYTCRFSDNTLQSQIIANGRRIVDCAIEEV